MTDAATPAAVETCGLRRRYGDFEALKGIDLTVRRGEMFALLGPNGAGKTTLFSILSTLLQPSAGAARVLGFDVVRERPAIRRHMGIVFQEPALEQKLSARDNLLLMGLFYGLGPGEARRRAEAMLIQLQLTEFAERPTQKLSGGQKRRLELARALISSPDILFLDEATLGLDVEARRSFWAQVRDLVRAGRTVFFTTHYMEEADVADRIALINEGEIVALDTPQALKQRIGGGVVRLQTSDDRQAREWLADHGHRCEPSDQGLVLISPDPAALLPALLRELPVPVLRAEIQAPSLENVFLILTGRALANGEAAAAPAGGQP